ncbi:MAG: hypothetical protein SOR94_03950 [Lawsonella sp.]|nr:hypothetical protein [Lawsonella sp.]MDY2979176.1 hypothetical protein [Lawsonella sp.]
MAFTVVLDEACENGGAHAPAATFFLSTSCLFVDSFSGILSLRRS